MTTSAAICIPYYNIAAIAADGQMTSGDRIAKRTTKKYMIQNGIGFVFAGEAYAGIYAARILKKIIPERGKTDIKKIVLEFHRRTFEDAGEGRRVGDAGGFIVGTAGLYSVSTVDLPVAVEPMNILGMDVYMDAIGTGGEYALGGLFCSVRAAFAAEFGNEAPRRGAAATKRIAAIIEERMLSAVSAGIHYDRNSGGTPSAEIIR